MCERQQARARPACDYLLFQLFPSTHSCEWERKWCVCECVCWFGGGEAGVLKGDGDILHSRKEESGEERATKKLCECVGVCTM